MTDLPFHLKTIEPLKGALDIIRLLGATDEQTVHADAICEQLDLSERSFSKAIRRLVTKGYVVMDGEMEYRLSEQGQNSVDELRTYDEATGGGLELDSAFGDNDDFDLMDDSAEAEEESQITSRRLVVAAPIQAVAQQANQCVVGVHAASGAAEMNGTAELVVRISVVNGEPHHPEDLMFSLSSDHTHQSLEITPGQFDEIRVRVEAFQLGDNLGEIHQVGGMYFDIPVTADADTSNLAAYGTDIEISI